MRIVFQTPWGAAFALAGLVPVAIAVWRERTAMRVRGALGLAPPLRRTTLLRPALLALAFVLLGLAAARPLVRTQVTQRARADAEAVLVLDSSRSMLAAKGRHGTPRWKRAIAAAEQIRAAIPEVPVGVATLNDRILPYLFPTTSADAFELVLHDAYTIDKPDPNQTATWTTTFGALDGFATHNFFSRDAGRKVAVLLTDGETRTYDPFHLTDDLRRAGIELVYVRFWDDGERIYRAEGKTETYKPVDPSVLGFAQTENAKLYSEAHLRQAIGDIRKRLGSGPTHAVTAQVRDVSVSAQIALLALCALLLVVVPALPLPRRRQLRRAAAPARRRRARVPAQSREAATRA